MPVMLFPLLRALHRRERPISLSSYQLFLLFTKLLDDELALPETHLDEIKQERVSRAKALKEKYLGAKLSHVKQDHSQASLCNRTEEVVFDGMSNSDSTATLHPVRRLYEGKVVLNSKETLELEFKTKQQVSSELCHSQQKLRITASVIKEVCHRKASSSCTAFVQKKIDPKVLRSPAVCYG